MNAPGKIRVVFLIPTYYPIEGGAQMFVGSLANYLAADVETTVLTRRYQVTAEEEWLGGQHVYRYWNPLPERWKMYASGQVRVRRYQKHAVAAADAVLSIPRAFALAGTNDVLHLHFPLPLGLAAVVAAKLRHKPLVVTVHGNADIYESGRLWYPVTRWILNQADAICAVGNDLAEFVQSQLRPRRPLKVIETAVDTESYSPATSRPMDGPVRLIAVSRLMPRKNLDVLVQAVRKLNSQRARVHLSLLGTGPEQGLLRSLAGDATQTGIELPGFVSEVEKISRLRRAEIFVQPSASEGLSRATVEAMACGAVPLVSDLRGVREPVEDGVTGFLIPDPASVNSLAESIEMAIVDRGRLREMSGAARDTAVARFSVQQMVRGYLEIYRRVVGRSTGVAVSSGSRE